ncbi:MAG TPA: RNA 2'-phosphotransferase [Dehalococcoidia bacterium]|nr:RNA 2'-phosphotransferase [Dehalococcoidia bacterium]
MDDRRLVRVSKYLSRHLRHQPERLGLALAPGGWVRVADLLRACAAKGFPISQAELREVVAHNDKQRFAFDAMGAFIRANQGHTITMDLDLESLAPPPVLYHGTGRRSVASIVRDGLRRMTRHHVHLSADVATARRVGARHGRPVVFAVDAAAMEQAGFTFYRSANGVWLVESVPPEYLRENCHQQQ